LLQQQDKRIKIQIQEQQLLSLPPKKLLPKRLLPQPSPLLPQQDKRIRIQIQEPHPLLLLALVLLHPQ